MCSCVAHYFGSPPNCRPECTISSECPADKSCINQRCVDPCPGVCGINAMCRAVNHNPICSCMYNYVGDPFVRCVPLPSKCRRILCPHLSRCVLFVFNVSALIIIASVEPVCDEPINPCKPSPCGPNAVCRVNDNRAICTCLPNYVGRAPNCRPECSIDSDCPTNLACVCDKCKDPCIGTCGPNAQCTVLYHRPHCSCLNGFTGDPFGGCTRDILRKIICLRLVVVPFCSLLFQLFLFFSNSSRSRRLIESRTSASMSADAMWNECRVSRVQRCGRLLLHSRVLR